MLSFKKVNIYVAFFTILFSVTNICCARIKSNVIHDGFVYKAFWSQEGNLIGILGDGLTVVDLNGNIKWTKELPKRFFLTNNFKLLIDNRLSILSPNDGIEVSVKELNGIPNGLFEEVSGKFSILERDSGINEINVFSNCGEFMWQERIHDFYPVTLLPNGQGILGFAFGQVANEMLIQVIEKSKEPRTIVSLIDPFLIESPHLIVVTNIVTNESLITTENNSWWATIGVDGKIIYESDQKPVSRADLIAPFGSGFVFAYSFGNEFVFVSNKGNIIWDNKAEGLIKGIDGNASNLAVSIGNMGSPGKIKLYNLEGGLKGTVDTMLTIRDIRISPKSPLIVGIQPVSKVYLFDFSSY